MQTSRRTEGVLLKANKGKNVLQRTSVPLHFRLICRGGKVSKRRLVDLLSLEHTMFFITSPLINHVCRLYKYKQDKYSSSSLVLIKPIRNCLDVCKGGVGEKKKKKSTCEKCSSGQN